MRGYKAYTIEDYTITKDGKIINNHNNHILKPQLNGKGYLRIWIGGKLMFVHRLVAEKYIPNPENKPQVNHINGIKTDNRVENLEWCDNNENRKHAVEHGLHLCGEDCSWSKLTEKDIIFIRENKHLGRSVLAKQFKVHKTTIGSIINNKSWKQLKRYAELSPNEVIEVNDKKLLR